MSRIFHNFIPSFHISLHESKNNHKQGETVEMQNRVWLMKRQLFNTFSKSTAGTKSATRRVCDVNHIEPSSYDTVMKQFVEALESLRTWKASPQKRGHWISIAVLMRQSATWGYPSAWMYFNHIIMTTKTITYEIKRWKFKSCFDMSLMISLSTCFGSSTAKLLVLGQSRDWWPFRGHDEQWLEKTKKERCQFREGLQALPFRKRPQARWPLASCPRRPTQDHSDAEEYPEPILAGAETRSLIAPIMHSITPCTFVYVEDCSRIYNK